MYESALPSTHGAPATFQQNPTKYTSVSSNWIIRCAQGRRGRISAPSLPRQIRIRRSTESAAPAGAKIRKNPATRKNVSPPCRINKFLCWIDARQRKTTAELKRVSNPIVKQTAEARKTQNSACAQK